MRKNRLLLPVVLSIFTAILATAQDYRTGIRIGWDYRSQTFMNSGSYGRMKHLSDGRLAFVYDQGGVCKVRFKPAMSPNFQPTITVATPPDGAAYTNAELLELQDGRLMYAYNERINGFGMKIKIKYSSDDGRHWQNEQTLYEVKTADYLPENEGLFGIWEPAMIQLPSGEVQLFFASEYRVPGHDQKIVMLRSTKTDDAGLRLWTDTVDVCYSVGFRDGMPVPLVLQDDRGIVFAIEDDGYGGGFQPGILYSTLRDNWRSGIRYGDSANRWVAVTQGEPRGGGAPYIIQLTTGETLVSTQTNALADTRGAPWDDMYKNRPFVYIGDATARHFGCYSIPFPFMADPDQGGVWNSLCQINDSTVMCVSEIHGHPSQNGLWTVEGRIMHPMTSAGMPPHTAIEDIDWAPLMSDILVGSQSQAYMNVGSCWSEDTLFLHFAVEDRMIRSGADGAPVWDTDGVEFYCDMGSHESDNVPAGAVKFLVNVDGGTLVTRMTSAGWTDVSPATYRMRYLVRRERQRYTIDMALPWNRLLHLPESRRFAGYVKLHNNDLYNSKEVIYHEVLSGVDEGRARTWWQVTLGEIPDGIATPKAQARPAADTAKRYNLQGIATSRNDHGIYIINGKKIVMPNR